MLKRFMLEAVREEIEELTKKNGGLYAKDISKDCTHLITTTTAGPKIERAIAWKIALVSPEWFEECLKAKGEIFC